MIPPFKFFVGGPIGDGKQYMSWIHRSDLVKALVFPIENEKLEGAYNVCSPNPATMNEVAETLGDVMNRPSFFRVPKGCSANYRKYQNATQKTTGYRF